MTIRPRLSRAAAGTIIAVFAILVLAADQFSKYLALQNLDLQVATPVLGDFLQLFLTFNPGAAFSLGEGVTWVFTLVLAIAALTVIALAFTRIRSRRWAFVLGALLGGVAGNLTDRLFRDPGFPVGHVVDFIYTPWMMPAIYNIADMFIVTSMVLVALLILLGIRFDGTREQPEPKADTVIGEVSDDDRYETRRERRERLAADAAAGEGIKPSAESEPSAESDDDAVVAEDSAEDNASPRS